MLFILLMTATGMSCQKTGDPIPQDLKEVAEKSAQLIAADNRFGLELFRRVTAEAGENDNTMISPLSVSLALAMTWNGAVGDTRSDMEKTLQLHGLTAEQINLGYKTLVSALASADPDVQLRIANAIFYHHLLKVRADFIAVNRDFFDAEVTGLDFRAPSALPAINGWVSEKTNRLIPTILDQLNPDLLMVLLNAIYFKGAWQTDFDEKGTHPLPFRFGDGTNGSVETMSMTTSLDYTSNDLFSAVNLPYGQGDFRMTVFLPRTGKSTADVIAALGDDQWNRWMNDFRRVSEVEVKMPRFKFAWNMTLNKLLSAMGMERPFSAAAADFSAITGNRDLYIGFVIHKTFIDVNEKGTEAAAVTAVGMYTTSMPADPPEKIRFTVDRPFLFAITERNTGAILFIGEMNAPVYE